MEQNHENLAKVLALLKLERDLNKNFQFFGEDGVITISELTRNLPQKFKDECYELLDKMEEEKEKKKNMPG